MIGFYGFAYRPSPMLVVPSCACFSQIFACSMLAGMFLQRCVRVHFDVGSSFVAA